MKRTLLALAVLAVSTSLLAVEPIHPQPKDTPSDVSFQKDKPPLNRKNDSRLPPHFDKNILDVTVTSDNPEETIKKITTILPSEKGKQYSIHIAITELPTLKEEIKPPKDVSEKPAIEENKVKN
ncbi:hypothetical protein A9G13_10920 [Gilliamella sp. wkB178]|uniref:hypothetical protein n=1 Tax=Gilliamella sp. wkB178 TaxID=3120259 RepID=UPI00080EC8E7|nr:hypothetical protein [Gilliamella apicola]OCG10006.1 hypothetical protein A9G13_10920 [Gilliamella apicola]